MAGFAGADGAGASLARLAPGVIPVTTAAAASARTVAPAARPIKPGEGSIIPTTKATPRAPNPAERLRTTPIRDEEIQQGKEHARLSCLRKSQVQYFSEPDFVTDS